METYFYKCPVCGFVYQVPAYWVSYDPQPEMEFPHLDLRSDTACECTVLRLTEET